MESARWWPRWIDPRMQILAIDQGTTSTKAHTVDASGRFMAVGTHRHRQMRPAPGWVEHDPNELAAAIRELSERAGPCTVAGLANQGETVVAWDARTKQPLHNAIVWQDTRTSQHVARLRAEGVEALTLERAGLPLDPYFSATKLAWLFDHADSAHSLRRSGRLRLGTSDAFLLDVLTGAFATDISTASRTSLLDLTTLRWDPALCAAFGVPLDCLPEIRPSVGDFGTLPTGPNRTEARLVASVADQQASLYGHACRAPGDLKITFGTGAFALCFAGAHRPRRELSGLLPTCAWQLAGEEPQYALDGGILTAGAAVEWLRAVELMPMLDELAAAFEPSAAERGLMFVPAQSGLGCPYWDRTARGLWLGLSLDTTRADLCHAVVEGIALRTAQVVRCFAAAGSPPGRVSIDGGLSRSGYFVRFLSNALGRPIHLAETPDLTGYGLIELCRARESSPASLPTPLAWRQVDPEAPLAEEIHQRFADAIARCRGWTRNREHGAPP